MSETSALESAQTRAGRCSFALLAAALLACAPDYETEHLRITTHLDFPLCEGNLDSYERMIDDFEVRIGTELRAPLDVELWNDRDWRAETRRLCGPRDVIACYNTVTHRVNGAFGQEILGHEIVHALMPTAVHSDLLFYEGTAVALSSSTVLAGGRPVLTPHSGEVDYPTAGHFVRWLTETRGQDCVRAVLEVRHAEAESTFAANCGSSFAAAVDDYANTAPWFYPDPFGCEFMSGGEQTLADQPLEFTVELDCASTDTFSGETGMYTFRTLHVAEAGRYLLWTDARAMTLRRCFDTIEQVAPTVTISDDGVPPYSIPFRAFFGGQFGMVRLEPGDHLLGVAIDSWTGAHEFTVRIEPAPPIVMVP